MPKTKTKKNIKVRDLKPKKDAKGGAHYLSPTRNAERLSAHASSNLSAHASQHN